MISEKVKILGLSGSPRKGNTEKLVKEALLSAESVGNVETEFISIAGQKIGPCLATYNCFGKATFENPCPDYKGDFCNTVLSKFMQVDGIIVGTPVYYGGPTAQIKAIFDRSMGNEALNFALRNKVGGCIAVAYDRNGGQESTVWDMIRWMMTHDMLVVSVGPERPTKTGIGSYYGAICMQGFPLPTPSGTSEGKKAAMRDEIGLASVRSLGKRVAEVTKMVKFSLSKLPEKELAWPKKLKVEMVEQYSKKD